MAITGTNRIETTRIIADLVGTHGTSFDDLDALLPYVYDELRALAHRQLVRERQDHTLQTTALVHEAYLRLVDDTQVGARGRAYFFASAARAMRQILVDYARRRNSIKRGEGRRPENIEEAVVGVDSFAVEIIDLDRALEALRLESERAVRVVECRFFGGMSVEETASALGLSVRTVKYDWSLARAWLFDYLKA